MLKKGGASHEAVPAEQDLSLVPFDEGRAEDDSSWAKENANNKAKIADWAASDPGPYLVAMCIIVRPQLSLVTMYFEQASTSWDEKQCHASITGGKGEYRIVKAASRRMSFDFFTDMAQNTLQESNWTVLLQPTHKLLSSAFVIISKAATGVYTLIHRKHLGFPFRLFSLLGDGGRALTAKDILRQPACLRCQFSATFLERFHSETKLVSVDSIASLVAAAELARLDTTRVECRFSSIRRLQLVQSLTHRQSFLMASSMFSLRRQRVIERER
jgi:hypothetical protein